MAKTYFFILLALALPFEAHAVPGPLVAWGMGIISNAGALFALAFASLVFAIAHSHSYIRASFHKHPKTFVAIIVTVVAVSSWVGYAVHSGGILKSDPFTTLRSAIKELPPSLPSRDEFSKTETLLAFPPTSISAKNIGYPELEKEIAFSVGRNRNVVWSRYLADGKIKIDPALISEIKRGAYVVKLSEVIRDANLAKPTFSLVDLRTVEEFSTSAHFKSASNLEFRKIMNDEVPFDRNATYVFACHDGGYDLSRSLVAAMYLRQKGIAAFALDTGMKPILDAFSIAPIAFVSRPPYAVWRKGDSAWSGTIVDPLGALAGIDGVKEAGFEIFPFDFYRMDSKTHESRSIAITDRMKKGENLRFACYDTFSCFYSRIFVEKYAKSRPEADLSILIFR